MDAAQYKCPNCNAELKFTPGTQELSCEYCESSFTIEEIKQIYAENEALLEEAPPEELAAAEDFEEHNTLYHCASCGADIMADDRQTALFCYYCHNPVILSGKLTGDFKPSKVIGFKLDRDTALGKFRQWCSKRKFLPKDFKTEQQLEKMTGLYVPFWVADCNIYADYSAIGRKVRSWTSGNYRYTETQEFNVVRQGRIITSGIPADGESKIDDLLMEAIEPFDYSELKDFSMSYLSGFYADKYDVDKAGVFPRIRDRANQASRKVISDSISGYTSVTVQKETYNIRKTDWEYMMLPVWFMTYKYKDKIYEFALNGQTGKLAGTPPLDKTRLKLFCWAIGGACTLLVYLIGGLVG
ncbi:MAG: hypothetical protein IJ874_01240 [Ruminococcus sp.]|nr:hypothetical protein [Ruminococcus sp.]